MRVMGVVVDKRVGFWWVFVCVCVGGGGGTLLGGGATCKLLNALRTLITTGLVLFKNRLQICCWLSADGDRRTGVMKQIGSHRVRPTCNVFCLWYIGTEPSFIHDTFIAQGPSGSTDALLTMKLYSLVNTAVLQGHAPVLRSS